jgi:hypothetical protein
MKIVLFLLLLFVAEYDGHFSRYRRNAPPPSGKYRISPKTGVRIALPSEYIDFCNRMMLYKINFNYFQHLNNFNGKLKKSVY